ncbi:cysteine desufuration protein SufE [Pseudoclavibacter endophyticus]|uniref:SufE family protein n=1 Tax=Pseudoclavibacter endophyticus TaxID=1778590 RepID=UPI001982CBED|nr:SufE family protein [Pseudoclavibacter endophyticus]GGA57717.1 cysteine desufuration protein SufE [Pseudoclavibacter endophyticus]
MTGANETGVAGGRDRLPAPLAEIRGEFHDLPASERLTLLLEFAGELPDLPSRYADHPDLLERVLECQSPVFLFVEVDDRDEVRMFASAPEEAPTTRGFASILQQGTEGIGVDELFAIDSDMPFGLGLTELVSPLRLRGMVGMLERAKRQARLRLDERAAAAAGAASAPPGDES